MTVVKVIKRSNPYVQIDKTGVSDTHLSWKARGLLVYLLSKPSNWEVSIKHLTKASDSDGRQSVQSGLKELEQHNYLVRFPYRDPETGLLNGWKSYIFETPEDCLNWKEKPDDSPSNRKPVHRGTRSTGNLTDGKTDCRQPRPSRKPPLINNDLEIINDLNNPPLTPPREEREERQIKLEESVGQTELVEVERESSLNSLADEPDCTDCLEKETNLSEDQPSAPPPRNVTKHEAKQRKYDSALGIRPPQEWKTRQQRQFEWVPDGPWLVDGKLDSNFVKWLAQSWQKQYGYDCHLAKANVLRHFKKDAANVAIAWSQYQGEQHQRYSNAALRMQSGQQIKADEQQQIWEHRRAITEQLPDEMNPVAVGQDGQWQQAYPQQALPGNVVAFPGSGENISQRHSASNRATSFSSSAVVISAQHSAARKGQARLTNSPPPTNEEGNALNPDAYKLWKPQLVEGEPLKPEQVRSKLTELTQKLLMPQPKTAEREPKGELEELNQWLADPILRTEVMARVVKGNRFMVEYDEQGQPIRVMEMAL